MSLSISSLNSGSNGNCYYVGNEKEAVLIDAGISCREIETRMARLKLELSKVKGIFISHEHSDHIKGVEVLSRKHKIPVYITRNTLRAGRLALGEGLHRSFHPSLPVELGDLTIRPFSKLHDAHDPHSFVVSANGIHVGILTDIGNVCDQVIHHFKQCHGVFLEANYDEEMLENGTYPFYLKKRIQSDVGHLSNAQAHELFQKHRSKHLNHLLLSHLSHENNEPQLVEQLFHAYKQKIRIKVLSREKKSSVFKVEGMRTEWIEFENTSKSSKQMTLF